MLNTIVNVSISGVRSVVHGVEAGAVDAGVVRYRLHHVLFNHLRSRFIEHSPEPEHDSRR